MNKTRKLRGGCLCGAVEYEVADGFEYAQYCHCSKCRRITGSAFKPFAGIERAHLKLTRGSDSFEGSKAGWHDILDDLPKYAAFAE